MLEKMNKKILSMALPAAIIIIVIAVGAFLIYTGKVQIGHTIYKNLSSKEAGAKAIEYINKNLLSGGVTASLENITEENGLYKLKLKISGQEYDSYLTKNGRLLFPTAGIELVEVSPTPAASPTPAVSPAPTSSPQTKEKSTCENVAKVNKAEIEAFIVSKCPYGLQMQRILAEIVKNIPSLAENIKVEYIGSIENNKIISMHGDEEAQENLRQICIREEQGSKYWDYVSCHIKKGDVDNCLTSATIDKTKLNSCMTDTSKGLKYAKADFDAQTKYSVSGSPTLFLNGKQVSEFDFGGRTAQAVKTLLCCGFKTNIDVCSQTLTGDQAATSFSETYSSASGATTNSSCGQ